MATLVDEWVRCGVTDAVVCPGKRSTLLAALLDCHSQIQVHVLVDERSAAFFALGLGMEMGRPAVLWTTSGTAAAQCHAAVIEAGAAHVPLLVCTADRPPELHHARDWQSMDQHGLYGPAVRWFFNPGVADVAMAGSWRSIAARAVSETLHNPNGPGPVHLNLPIREPWRLEAGELPPARGETEPWHRHYRRLPRVIDEMVEALAQSARRGVIVVGKVDVNPAAVHAAAALLGWPVLAEVRSGCRLPLPTTIAAADELLRVPGFAQAHQPEVVVRLGTPVLSKVVAGWLEAAQAQEWSVDPYNSWLGPAVHAAHVVHADPTEVCQQLASLATRALGAAPPLEGWLADWQRAEAAAQVAIDSVIDAHIEPTEPGIARRLLAALPDDTHLFAGTSMAVREVEWYGGAREGVRVLANRGVSGLDGLLSTAAGMAVAHWQGPNVALVGDLGFLYDLNALWTTKGSARPFQLAIVVVDNGGGGMFSFFPELAEIGAEAFERVVATPQSVDIVAAATGLGVPVERVEVMANLVPALDRAVAAGGVRVIYIRTDRNANVALHAEIHTAVSGPCEDV